MTKNILSYVVLLLVGLFFLSAPASAKTFSAGNIIDDSVFTNANTMTVNQIQTFLNNKVVTCDTNGLQQSEMNNTGVPDVNGNGSIQRWEWGKHHYNQTTFPCLKGYIQDGKSSAQIIYDVSVKYSINPQVMLVLLQKEQVLITDTWPSVVQYRSATGYGCPDTAPCDTQYYGLINQLDWAAKMFRSIMNASPGWYTPYVLGNNTIRYNPQASCGSSIVNIQNRATQALYNYTPYRPNDAALAAGYGSAPPCGAYGNRNFWLYFNDWFGNANGTLLLQSPASPAIFLQSGNTRYGVPSWDVLRAYGLNNTPVTAVSDSYMQTLTDGGTLSTVFTKKGETAVYLADNGYRFGFATYQQCIDWGFPRCLDAGYAKALEPAIFDKLHIYGALRPLMLNGSHVSRMRDGKKETFLSGIAMTENGYTSANITPITNPLNLFQPFSYSIPQNNSFVSFKSNGTIYAYNQGKFYPLTYDAFKGLYSKDTPILTDNFSLYVNSSPVPEATISPLVSVSTGKSFLLTNDSKIDITTTSLDFPIQQNIDNIQVILNRKTTSTVTSNSSTFRTNAGAIFEVKNKEFRPFYSLHDYFSLGHTTPLSVSNNLPALLTQGEFVVAPGAGSLYQVKTPGKEYGVFALSLDGSVCQISSLSQFSQFSFNTANVKRITEPLTVSKVLSNWVRAENGNTYLFGDSGKTLASSSVLQTYWGITNAENICTFTTKFLTRTANTALSLSRFARSDSGIIYYGETGKKRPIYSYQAFINLGGNANNTVNVPQVFLDASPTGEPIN